MNSANRLKVFLFFAGDAIALYAALFLTLLIRAGANFYEQFVDVHAYPFTIVFALWLIIFYIAGLYDLRRLRNNLDFIKTLFLSLAINAVIAALLFYSIPAFGIAPKTNLLIFIVLFAIIEVLWRRGANRLMTFGDAPNKVLMVGNGAVSEELKAVIRENPQLGYEIKTEMTDEQANATPESLKKFSEENGVNLIVVPHQLRRQPQLVTVLYELFGKGILVSDLVSFYELIMRKIPLAGLEESWFIENIASKVRFYDQLKRASEFLAALLIGIVLSPLELLIAIVIKLSSPGPVIYRQTRVGEKEREFTLYKFRTMPVGSEKNGAVWASENDRRATPFGRFLRKTHLDELPQLWNIIRGDLSFVGPRPERPEFVVKLEAQIPYYEVRLLIKPGVTGWAQINYHKDTTTDDVMQKLQHDIYYLKNRSVILDWAIILKTLKSIFVSAE